MKKVLTITIPPFVAYHDLTFNMVVILTSDNLKNYIYNNFIQWVCPKDYLETNDFYINTQGSSYFNNEYIYGPCVSKHMLKDDYERILKEYINQGRYIAMEI